MPVILSGVQYSGSWTLQQQMQAKQAGTWPNPPALPGLYSWGTNNFGQLGQNDSVYRSSPVQVGSDATWSTIDGGDAFTFAIKTNGTLWSWGRNDAGQLGQNDTIYRSSPVQVGALTTWSKVSCGSEFTIAVKTDGTLWSWGYNGGGQLGQNISYLTRLSSPVQVGALTTWSTVACGQAYTLAIKTDGTLWSWGVNSYGQLGQNILYSISRSSPVQIGALTTWSKISSNNNGDHSIATKTNGTLWAWGYNGNGQLGQNNTTNLSSPVQVGALTTWSNIACLRGATLATKTDGSLWSWGQNNFGQLGQNDTARRSSPVQVGALTTWLNITGGSYHTIATKTDGTLWTWGRSNDGQLGQGDTQNKSSPVQLGTGTTWSEIGAGNVFSLAIRT